MTWGQGATFQVFRYLSYGSSIGAGQSINPSASWLSVPSGPTAHLVRSQQDTEEAAQVIALKPVSPAAQRAIEVLIPLTVYTPQTSPHSCEEENYGEKGRAALISFWEIWMGVFISLLQVLLSTNDRMNDLRKQSTWRWKKGLREMKGEKNGRICEWVLKLQIKDQNTIFSLPEN